MEKKCFYINCILIPHTSEFFVIIREFLKRHEVVKLYPLNILYYRFLQNQKYRGKNIINCYIIQVEHTHNKIVQGKIVK